MKLAKILPFTLLMATSPAFSQASKTLQAECWDGTFAYNTALISQTEDGVEIGFQGANTGPLELYSWDDGIFVRAWQYAGLFYRFKNEECEFISASQVRCETTADSENPALYVERRVGDLGETISVLSPGHAKKIVVIWDTDKGATLTVTGARIRATDQDDVQSIAFTWNRSFCSQEAPGRYNIEFPERLREFLNTQRQ